MHVFYTPDIQKSNELPDEEAQHCIRVLRLNIRDYGSDQQALSGGYQGNRISGAALALSSSHWHGTNKEYGP